MHKQYNSQINDAFFFILMHIFLKGTLIFVETEQTILHEIFFKLNQDSNEKF